MPKPDECRRCGDCKGASHHWLPNSDFGDDGDPENPASVEFEFVCKHCPAMGGECPDCDGEGLVVGIGEVLASDGSTYPDEVETSCKRCGGEGVIEGLRFEDFAEEAADV